GVVRVTAQVRADRVGQFIAHAAHATPWRWTWAVTIRGVWRVYAEGIMIQPKTLSGTIDLDLPEFDAPPDDPMPLLLQWVDTALRLGVVEPFNVALATSGTDGRPSNRMILAKTFDADGMTFASNASSAKGRELAAN